MRSLAVVSRFSAAILGGYAFAYGFVAFAALVGFSAGLRYSDAQTLAWMLSFLVYLGAMIWGFSARNAVRVWLVLGGGSALMAITAWALAKVISL